MATRTYVGRSRPTAVNTSSSSSTLIHPHTGNLRPSGRGCRVAVMPEAPSRRSRQVNGDHSHDSPLRSLSLPCRPWITAAAKSAHEGPITPVAPGGLLPTPLNLPDDNNDDNWEDNPNWRFNNIPDDPLGPGGPDGPGGPPVDPNDSEPEPDNPSSNDELPPVLAAGECTHSSKQNSTEVLTRLVVTWGVT